jgi:hypothetical protein
MEPERALKCFFKTQSVIDSDHRWRSDVCELHSCKTI